MNIELTATDDRFKVLNNSESGVYCVVKNKVIKEFEFGEHGYYSNSSNASEAVNSFLENRKDSESLNVTLIPR